MTLNVLWRSFTCKQIQNAHIATMLTLLRSTSTCMPIQSCCIGLPGGPLNVSHTFSQVNKFIKYWSDRFSKSFHRHIQQYICNVVNVKHPATPQTRCYTTVAWGAAACSLSVKYQFSKADNSISQVSKAMFFSYGCILNIHFTANLLLRTIVRKGISLKRKGTLTSRPAVAEKEPIVRRCLG